MEEANGVYPWNINYQSIGLGPDFEIVDSLKCEVSIPTLVLLAFYTLIYLPPWGDNPMDCNPILELLPIKLRSIGCGNALVSNYTANLLVTLTFSLLKKIGPKTYFLFLFFCFFFFLF